MPYQDERTVLSLGLTQYAQCCVFCQSLTSYCIYYQMYILLDVLDY